MPGIKKMIYKTIKILGIFAIWFSVLALPGLLSGNLQPKNIDTIFVIAGVFAFFNVIYLNRSAKNKLLKDLQK